MDKVAILFMQYRQKNSNHTKHRFRGSLMEGQQYREEDGDQQSLRIQAVSGRQDICKVP
jgi:hypothetical protein